MKSARALFGCAALFAATIAVVYGVRTHEAAGTTLLGFLAAALTVLTIYVTIAERDAGLYADKPDATMAEAAGEHVGTFIVHSPIPFWIGLALTGIVLGAVVAPVAAGLGIIALLLLGALLVVRSR